MKKDLVFMCKKCRRHLLFISGTPSEKVKKIASLNNHECEYCGEEGYENWIGIFEIADYKIVGDLNEILPLLLEKTKRD